MIEGNKAFSSDKENSGVSIQIIRNYGVSVLNIEMVISNKSSSPVIISPSDIKITALHRSRSNDPIYSSLDTVQFDILDEDSYNRSVALSSRRTSLLIKRDTINPMEIIHKNFKLEMTDLRFEWLNVDIRVGNELHDFRLIPTKH